MLKKQESYLLINATIYNRRDEIWTHVWVELFSLGCIHVLNGWKACKCFLIFYQFSIYLCVCHCLLHFVFV